MTHCFPVTLFSGPRVENVQVTAGATPPPPPCLPPLRDPSFTTSAMVAASTASGSGRVPTQGPSIGRPPPSSPTRDATAAAGGDVRTEKPSFNLWGLADLKAEAIRQAGRRKGLKFGPLPGDEVRQISNANRPDLIHALVARMAWRERLNLEPEWSGIRLGVTPEKRKRKQEKIIAKAKKLAGGGVGKKQPRVAKNQGYVCRLVCLTLLEEFYDEYLRSRGGGGGHRALRAGCEGGQREAQVLLPGREGDGNRGVEGQERQRPLRARRPFDGRTCSGEPEVSPGEPGPGRGGCLAAGRAADGVPGRRRRLPRHAASEVLRVAERDQKSSHGEHHS